MKIIKRSGTEVTFDIAKIMAAVSKANKEVVNFYLRLGKIISDQKNFCECRRNLSGDEPLFKRRRNSGSGGKPDYESESICSGKKIYYVSL